MYSINLCKHFRAFIKCSITEISISLGQESEVLVSGEGQGLAVIAFGEEKEVVASWSLGVGIGQVDVGTGSWKYWYVFRSGTVECWSDAVEDRYLGNDVWISGSKTWKIKINVKRMFDQSQYVYYNLQAL